MSHSPEVEGRLARRAGLPKSANPYPTPNDQEGVTQHDSWYAGWDDEDKLMRRAAQ